MKDIPTGGLSVGREDDNNKFVVYANDYVGIYSNNSIIIGHDSSSISGNK